MRRSLSILPFVTSIVLAQGENKPVFSSASDAFRSGSAMNGRNGPANVNWIDGGARYSYIGRDDKGQPVIRSYEPATGKDTILFSAAGVMMPGTKTPFAYTSFQWAADSKYLVFQKVNEQLFRNSAYSDYFIYSLARRELRLAGKNARTAELAPDGRTLGLERDGDMYAVDLATGAEKRLTTDGTPRRYNGHFDWVYEEEFGKTQAWNWSPDSKRIAFWQLDESAEPVVQLSDFSGSHPEWEQLRIPQPGDKNATAKVGVVDVATGRKVWLDPKETGEFYIPRMYWTSERDTLAVITLNRKQNVMRVHFFDVRNGGHRLVLEQKSDAWIDVYDFYAGVNDLISFPPGAREFFWVSDADGWQHIYRYDYSGKPIQQVTKGKWMVTRIEGVDAKNRTIYYTGTQASPLQRQLYAVGFDGGAPRQLTSVPGVHRIDMAPDTRFYLDRWSSTKTPTQVELWATGDKMLKKLEDNAAVSQFVASHAFAPTELRRFTTSDGAAIDYSVVKPVGFDSTRKYPVVFAIYGGPGSQQVYDSWSGSSTTQWLASQGYVVVGVNNRGSNNYGSAFMKVVYKDLGKWEAHDFAETARELKKERWVDGDHVGIIGTSYGGYSTVITMELYPDVFTAGVANSPGTDWRLYDTIYTERYMSVLEDNKDGYERSSAVVNAPKLKGHLLLVHSMMDDNVHVQHTMQLVTALTDAGKDAPLRIYPPGRHGAAYNTQSRLLIQDATDEWLARWLKPSVRTQP